MLAASSAYASESAKAPSGAIFLTEILLLILTGRLLGEAMSRIGQSSIMGELLAGILLGPSVFGWLWPDLQHWIFPAAEEQKAMINAISQFAILLLLLLTGMEIDLKLVRKTGKAAIAISIAGIAVPFACGVTLGWFMPESLLPVPERRLLTSLFLGTALSISSIKIVAAMVREMNFARRTLGQVIVASAIMEDTIGWIIIATIFSLAEAGQIDAASVAKSVIGTAVFLALSFTIGQWIVSNSIRWANDNFVTEFPVITAILTIMSGMALATYFIGIHVVLGAFVAGVLAGQSPILTSHISEQLRGLTSAFFRPVLFGLTGLSADLTILKNPALLLMALGLIAIASIGKLAGAFIGGEIGGLTRREALAVACGMNARGTTEVIVAMIGLSMGVLSQNLFTMIVVMAVTTTMAMPPMLRWGLSRVPLGKEEEERLAREEFAAKRFVPHLERLLLAADESANGRFASHIAGLIAGRSGIPATVLQLADRKQNSKQQKADAGSCTTAGTALKAAAENSKKSVSKEDAPAAVGVTVRKLPGVTKEEAVASEAKKGYDLMVIGIGNMKSSSGTFNLEIGRMAAAFEGPLAIVMGQGDHLKHPNENRLNILVPVTGTSISRRAAEIAIVLACACGSPITALYVNSTAERQQHRRVPRKHRHEEVILKDIIEAAHPYDIKIRTAMRSDVSAGEAILMETKERSHNLIVMGVNRRPGDYLFFGDTAAAVLEKFPGSLLFLSN